MFQDIGVSKDLNEHFKRHLVQSADPLDSKCKSKKIRFLHHFTSYASHKTETGCIKANGLFMVIWQVFILSMNY